MKFEPLVTVITVTYNSEKYVRDAIESVLQQTYRNIEYIIADDASTDKTWDIINEYKDQRIISYRNEVNIREYPNRNKALSLAKGDYVIFIDGDDHIYLHGISSFVTYAEKFPEAGMFIQKGYYNNIILPLLLSSEQAIRNYYFDKINFITSSFASNFIKREALKFVGGLSNEYKTGDEDIRIKIAASFPISIIPGWLTWPRETPGQASSMIPDEIRLREYYDQAKALILSTKSSKKIAAFHSSIERKVMNLIKRYIFRKFIHAQFSRAFKCKKQYNIPLKAFLSFGSDFSEKNIIDKSTVEAPLKGQIL